MISIENGRTILTDLSTNGVYINGARQPTLRDSRVELTDGDAFRLGEYTIAVTEIDDVSPHARSGPRGGAMPDPFAEIGPRGGIDPFAAPPGPAEGRDPLDIDPLDDPLGRPPDPAFQHPVAHRPLGPQREDPFDVAEERARRPIDPDDDLFRGAKPAAEWQGPTQADHADAPLHAFATPRVLPVTDPNAIDFDALIGDVAPPGSPPATPPPRPLPPPQARPAPRDPFADLDALLSPSPAPSPAHVAPPQALPEDPFAELERPPVPAAPARPEPAAPVAAPAAVPQTVPVQAHADDRRLLLAFLEGAGLPGAAAGNADPEATLRAVGQVFRAMTEGLREVLMSRAAIKGDMRVEQTMIQARNNNALKFSVTAEDAVTALLTSDRPGYMPPLAATKEAFNDLKSHELAVMAGVQTALLGLLKRFEPAALEARLSQGLLGAVLPAARKARYWDSFCQVYGDIAREAEDDFQAVFGRAFAKAYTEQSRKTESGGR